MPASTIPAAHQLSTIVPSGVDVAPQVQVGVVGDLGGAEETAALLVVAQGLRRRGDAARGLDADISSMRAMVSATSTAITRTTDGGRPRTVLGHARHVAAP